MNAMTAAHKTLPLGTHVKVTNLKDGRSCILRVNDRGPFVAGRIIDLSHRGAQEIGVAQKGTAQVRVEAVQVATEQHVGQNTYWKVDPLPSLRYGKFNIQIGAFRDQANASRLRSDMAMRYTGVYIIPILCDDGYFYRVQLGTYNDLYAARTELDNLKSQGFNDAFVVSVDEGK
jgi:rare lipoprotein A